MWWAYIRGDVLHKPSTTEFRLLEGKLTIGLSMAGVFEFSIPKTHPKAQDVRSALMENGAITVERGTERVFRGRALKIERSPIEGCDRVVCEGELAELNDSVQLPYEFSGSPASYLGKLLASHNMYNGRFEVGRVSVNDSNDYIVRSSESAVSVLSEMKAKTFGSSTGGYILVRHDDGRRFVDWVESPDIAGGQEVRFAKNLMSLKEVISGEGFFTAVYPRGQRSGGEQFDLSVVSDRGLGGGASLVGGIVRNDGLVARYGQIVQIVSWDDVTLEQNLLSKAAAYARDLKLSRSIEVSAVDLSEAGYEVEAFAVGQRVPVIAPDIEETMLISQMSFDFDNPSNNKITFEKPISSSSGNALIWNDAKKQAQEARYQSKKAQAIAKDACTVEVTASHGYAFTSDTATTKLKATVFRAGGETIESIDGLKAAFGPDAKVLWSEYGGGSWNEVLESRLSDGGMSLVINADQVNGKSSYRVSVTRG